jgi:hypothetical protein
MAKIAADDDEGRERADRASRSARWSGAMNSRKRADVLAIPLPAVLSF